MLTPLKIHARAPRHLRRTALGVTAVLVGAALATAGGTASAHDGDHPAHAFAGAGAQHGGAPGGYRGAPLMHANWHGGHGVAHFGAPAMRADWHGGGRWEHGWHGGHFGWWYIDAGVWSMYPYYYPYGPYYGYSAPYPYAVAPEAPAVTGNVPAQVQSWYYCDEAKGYYPYVNACPGGWRAVPATPPPPSAPTPPPAR